MSKSQLNPSDRNASLLSDCFQQPAIHSPMGNFNRLDIPLFIKLHPVNAGNAMVGVLLGQRSAMLHYIPFIRAWNLKHRMVSGACRYRAVLLENLADPLKWTEW